MPDPTANAGGCPKGVLRLLAEALEAGAVPKESFGSFGTSMRREVLRIFHECLVALSGGEPVALLQSYLASGEAKSGSRVDLASAARRAARPGNFQDRVFAVISVKKIFNLLRI